MTEGTIIQHPPAIKVGGRRLSISMKHKAVEAAVPNATQETDDKAETTVPDYPRPVPPTAVEEAAQQQAQHNEELPPKKGKKEKKYNHHDKKGHEYPHLRTETTRPTREISGRNKGQIMGVRIGQPAGKALGF